VRFPKGEGAVAGDHGVQPQGRCGGVLCRQSQDIRRREQDGGTMFRIIINALSVFFRI
jgi:hypothetical protein